MTGTTLITHIQKTSSKSTADHDSVNLIRCSLKLVDLAADLVLK